MANFAPEIPVSMCRAANQGKLEEARSIFVDRLLRFRHLDVPGLLQGYPIQNAYIKEAMNLSGDGGRGSEATPGGALRR